MDNLSFGLDLWVLVRSVRQLFGAPKIELHAVPTDLMKVRRVERRPELVPSVSASDDAASHAPVSAISA